MIDANNDRAPKDRVNVDPPLSTPGEAERAKLNTFRALDLTPWQEGTGKPPETTKFPD